MKHVLFQSMLNDKRLRFFEFCATCGIGEIQGVKDLGQAAPSCSKVRTTTNRPKACPLVFPRIKVAKGLESEMPPGMLVTGEAAKRASA